MTTEPTITLTRTELEAIVKETVNETLTRLGIDHSNPQELQRDMQHLRDWRMGTQQVKKHALTAAMSTVAAGVLAALWLGFKELVGK